MAIDIIASVIPNIGVSKGDDYNHFYIFLTPRISCSEEQSLENFRYIYNWNEYVDLFSDRFHFELLNTDYNKVPGGLPNASRVAENYCCHGLSITKNAIQNPKGIELKTVSEEKIWMKTLWRAMFGPETVVDELGAGQKRL